MTWAGEPELAGEYLIAPELEPELVLFYSCSPALTCTTQKVLIAGIFLVVDNSCLKLTYETFFCYRKQNNGA